MSIAVWIAIALACFVLPAVALTNGGKKMPGREALGRYAQQTGLPLTDTVAAPVVERIRRRERGMWHRRDRDRRPVRHLHRWQRDVGAAGARAGRRRLWPNGVTVA